MQSELKYLYKFKYHARYGETGSEREYCWVYAGKSNDRVTVNGNEVADWRFIDPAQLEREMANQPGSFTPWFKMEWQRISSAHRHELSNL